MDRNVKIALGCGGAGCLGLIVVMVAGIAIYYFSARTTSTNRNANISSNQNRTANSNANNDNDNDSSSSNSSSSLSSMSEDDQHRLFHAASVTRDTELIRRVSRKLGLVNSDNSPNEKNVDFATAHVSWVFRNSDFIQEIDTPAKGRAYVDRHIND